MIRVLVADSNPPTREQLRAHLASDPDIEIVSLARDGQEALQMAHQYRPDVAILAADLNVQDGYQTAEFLASADPWFRPVHATTGPDGGLWVVDMCRFVIEHPRWIPACLAALLIAHDRLSATI